MTFSIVINTFNRVNDLRNCLATLKNQRYSEFEVIVVNGPSTDETEAFCLLLGSDIKYFRCPDRNLSRSRNIGIQNSSGDICAFLDDDAMASPTWLQRLASGYDLPEVVGVGGYTLDKTGRSFQARAVLCDRLGNDYPTSNDVSSRHFCFPGSPLYPSLLGTNSSFRREALLAIGGFDEVFAYFLDETDICLRLVDAGGIIKYVPDALVHHMFSPSHLRSKDNIPKSRYMPCRSKTYFMLRHGASLFDGPELTKQIATYKQQTLDYNKYYIENNIVDRVTYNNLNFDVELGVSDGRKAAAEASRRVGGKKLETTAPHKGIARYKTEQDHLRIVFICKGYPPGNTQGIARWTHTLARHLAQQGQVVHVVTETEESANIKYSEGVWIHSIRQGDCFGAIKEMTELYDLPGTQLNWSAAAHSELMRIGFDNIDIVSAPIWDLEGLMPLLFADVPVVTSLHTTYALALPHKPDWLSRPLYCHEHVQKIIDGENSIFRYGQYFLANSESIVKDIEGVSGISLHSKSILVPHGIDDVAPFTVEPSEGTQILFVGRQESRKGFDTAIDAAIRVCMTDPKAVFTFVGSACDDAACKKAVSIIPAPYADRIVLKGLISEEELWKAYQNCTIFLVPSRYESFGLTAIEAMRCGKAIISSNRGGLGEIIKDGVNGLHVNPDDANSIAKAILLLIENVPFRQNLEKMARKDFETLYTAELMAKNAIVAYREFIKDYKSKQNKKATNAT